MTIDLSRLMSLFRYHTARTAEAGAAVLSGLARLLGGRGMELGLREVSELVYHADMWCRVETAEGLETMEGLLEGAAAALEGGGGGAAPEMGVVVRWTWERFYLAALNSGSVLKQGVYENICGYVENKVI